MVSRLKALALGLGAAIMMSGCAAKMPSMPDIPFYGSDDDPYADNTCPWRVKESKAWINKMPGIDAPAAGRLNVFVRFKKQETPLKLAPAPALEDADLALEIVESDDIRLGVAGASYRLNNPKAPINRIIIQCEGQIIDHIDHIKSVY